MTKTYRLIGCFNNEDYSINVNVKTITVLNKEEAEAVASKEDLGEVFFDSQKGEIYHKINGDIIILDKSNVDLCEVLKPRTNYNHETLMGLPIYEKEDFEKISLNELIRGAYKEAIKRGNNVIFFENIAYALFEIKKEGVEIAQGIAGQS